MKKARDKLLYLRKLMIKRLDFKVYMNELGRRNFENQDLHQFYKQIIQSLNFQKLYKSMSRNLRIKLKEFKPVNINFKI